MATARQFITPVTNPDRCGALGCWSQAVAVTGALAICALFFAAAVFAQSVSDSLGELLVGKAAFGDWRTDAPLVRRKITELPPPYATRSASNPPRVIAKPVSAAPRVPPGFQVELFASNLRDPRTVRVASNGDIFIANDSSVWGRPVGVAVSHDGALLVSEDGNGTMWRISYRGGP
jgi:glucose/arabinose dehydrogenase